MKNLTLLLLIIGIGLFNTLNAQSLQRNDAGKDISKSRIIKMKPFSPLLNNVALGYEQRIKSNISAEATFGLIGTGFQPVDLHKRSGFYLSAGPRLYFGQDWKMEGMEHLPLRGYYFKPEVIFSTYKSSPGSRDEFNLTRTYSANSGALIFNVGRQFIAADIISLEFSAGMGYGFSNYSYDKQTGNWESGDYGNGRFYSHIQGPNELPVAAKADITIGFLLK